jgi:phytoene desaturase
MKVGLQRRTMVVGAGIAGIATSIRLAVRGHSVDVFEANSYPGGKLSSFTQEGFRYDAGPSLFTMPHLVDELFALAGKDAGARFPYTRLEEACRYFYPDGKELTAWTSPKRFSEAAAEAFGVPVDAVELHLASAAKKYALTKGIFLERSLHRWGSYLNRDVLHALVNLPGLDLLSSMHAVNARRLKEPHLVQLFDRYATYNGSSPYSAPGVMNLIPHLEHGMGAAFPHGGMVAITTSLVALAEELGVRFHYSSGVEEIVVAGGRAVGLKVGGEVLGADTVVCNMDIVPAYRKLLAGQRAPERILRHERSSSALIHYWGVRRSFPSLGLHNIFFAKDYAAEFKDIFGGGRIHTDPTVYVHISAKACPADAPAGMENWFVMVNVPSDQGQDWDQMIPVARRQVLEKLSRMLDLDLEAEIVCESVLDPRGIAARTSSFGGALYGASSNDRLSAFLRHANFSSRIGGLYFCGGSVHPGGGIPLCLLSARIVSDLIAAA